MALKKSRVSSGMKAVILVGGPGTRLRPLTDDRPKPMVPVLNRPYLEHVLAHLKQFGIEDIVLAMSYLPDPIREYFGDGERCSVRLAYCLEKEPLGTAGAVKNAAAYLDRPFVVLNGDNVFTDMNFNDMLAFHREKKAKATISLTWVDNPGAFGVVETDASNRVSCFIEKPPPGTETTNWINAGGYILEPDVLEYIPAGQHYMFERGLFPRLLDIGAPVYGYAYKGYWLDMGTPEKYFKFNMDMLFLKTKSPLLPGLGKSGVYINRDADIHPTARITGPVLLDSGCKIGRDVNIKGPAIIGRGCFFQDASRIENAILWDNVAVGKNASLCRCIIGNNVVIANNHNVQDSVVTASRTASLSV